MTLAQLELLHDRFDRREQREELLVGLLASVTANYSMRGPEEPLSVTDFMSPRFRPKPVEEDEAVLAARFDAFFSNAARSGDPGRH
jgi:hypothetical protein